MIRPPDLAARIAAGIERATSIAELRPAALQVDELIESLHGDGAGVELIARHVRELNGNLLARLWSLLAPHAVRSNSCLFVMGSEGRGEQIVKTDQDNALLLRNGFEDESLADLCERFTAALVEFGYPLCPGNIMLSNPLWRQPIAGFRESLRDWIHGSDPHGPMHLAIFLDARAVVGDTGLLGEARDYVDRVLVDNQLFYARFASAIDQFGERSGWRSRLLDRLGRNDAGLDLKKLGIFPIVHGVRSLALQYRVRALGTSERLAELCDRGHVDPVQARALIDALHVLIGLKLMTNLRQRRFGQLTDNVVRTASLCASERAALENAFASARRFRQWLRWHYRLDVL